MFQVALKFSLTLIVVLASPNLWSESNQKKMRSLPKKQAIQQVRSWIDNFRSDQKTFRSADLDLKIDFLFRMASGMESRYKETDDSLLETVRIIHEQERNELQKRGSPLYIYLTHLLDCLDHDREPAEPILTYIHEYLQKSPVINPLSLSDYGSHRDYRASGIAQKAGPAPTAND